MVKPSIELEPRTWGQLPQELLEHILLFLPLSAFFNLRSTCKRFYSLTFSPSFISKHSSVYTSTSPFSSFLLLSHPQFQQHFPLYDSTHGHWRMLSLPSSNKSSSLTSHLLSVSNGLLCISLPSSSSFVICNLLARSSRIISFPYFSFLFESVTLIPSSNGYKIFVLCTGSPSNSVYIYDSTARSWNRFPGINIHNLNQEGVFSHGNIYFTTPEPFSIAGFDLRSGNWTNSIEELPGEGQLTFLRLVSDREEMVYLIGGIGRHGISRSMTIWELTEDGGGRRGWVEVGSLPEMMCKKFMSICYHNYEHVHCFYHEGVICMCCYTWPEVLCYKIARQTWHWLPKCPSLPEKWSCGFKWFSFVPNLYALV